MSTELDSTVLFRRYAEVYRRLRSLVPYRDLLFQLVYVAHLTDASRVLDVCCGDGGLLWALEASGLRCEVVGIDTSSAMLKQAAAEPYRGRARFQRCDLNAPAPGLGLGQFDVIACNNGLYALDDPPAVLRYLHSLAQPQARLVISTFGPQPNKDAILAAHLAAVEAVGGNPVHEAGRLKSLLAEVDRCNADIMALARTGAFHAPPKESSVTGLPTLVGVFAPSPPPMPAKIG